jgi:hypothetical protein
VYGKDEVYFIYTHEAQERHLQEAINSHAPAISGHINWHAIASSGVLDYKPFLFTFIRRPQDQVISHFMHKRRGHKWSDRNQLTDDFRQFMATDWSKNWQSCVLSGLPRGQYHEPNVDELQEMALRHLQQLDLCAGTDQLPQAVQWMKHHFAWKRTPLEDRNVSEKSHLVEVLHEVFDKQLKELNRADHALYRYSKAKMKKAWDELPFWKRW